MTRWPVLCALALINSGCGLLIDGVYLLTDRHAHESVEQRRPTGQSEVSPERRLVFEGPNLRVACEDVTRGVDRVWTVEKDFENQGGWYQAHWLPVILEGTIGAALAIGLAVKCPDPASNLNCNLLYGTIPFGVDVSYSLVRLLTVEPRKLVDKRATLPHTEHHADPLSRAEISCPSDTVVVASAPGVSAGPLEIPIVGGGWIAPADEQRLYTYVFSNARTQVSTFSGAQQQSAELGRCEFLKARRAANPASIIPADCQPQPAR